MSKLQDIRTRPWAIVQNLLADNMKKDMIIVEVGSWTGASTTHLAEVAKECNGVVYAIDHWKGNENSYMEEAALENDIFAAFRKNMESVGITDYVKPMVMPSHDAARIFKKADFIHIDGGYTYDWFTEHLRDWWPKLKKGGMMVGRGLDVKYGRLKGLFKEQVDSGLDKIEHSIHMPYGSSDGFIGSLNIVKELHDELIEKVGNPDKKCRLIVHCGAIKALHDFFGDDLETEPLEQIWWKYAD